MLNQRRSIRYSKNEKDVAKSFGLTQPQRSRRSQQKPKMTALLAIRIVDGSTGGTSLLLKFYNLAFYMAQIFAS